MTVVTDVVRTRAREREGLEVDVMVMRLSDDRADYFVRIKCGDRSVTPHVFRERFKAEYEVAHLRWVFGLREDEPYILDYDETTYPNLTREEAARG